MVRKRNGLKNPLKNNKGMTIVNVLVAFVILLICSVMFQQALKISTDFMDKSSEIRQNLEAALESYYMNEPPSYSDNTLNFTGTDGSFNVKIKYAKTDNNGITLYYYKYQDAN